MDVASVCEKFKIYTESNIEKYRAETFFQKEPETIAWIEKFIKDREIFIDVGANVGIYSLYVASLHRNSFVCCFEPFLANYLRLEENISLNLLPNIKAFNAGLGNQTRMVNFYSPKIEPGSSGGQVGTTVDEHGKKFNYLSMQQIPVYRFDDFMYLFKLPPPNHIKIDVDGQEEQVIAGMATTLQNYLVKSVLVEVNPLFDKTKLETFMRYCGYTADNEFNKMENHSRVRRAREGVKAENVIYTRQ